MRNLIFKIASVLPDKLYMQLMYYKHFRRFIDWEKPKTFSEKIQWLKLNDRKPEYPTFVDKILVKDYVKNVIGDKYVIPLLGVFNSGDEIQWDSLPAQFVLKTNHSGGNTGVIICRDKDSFDKEAAVRKLKISLAQNSFAYGREWPYKQIKKRVFAEQLMQNNDGVADLKDYKFFCFNGEPKLCQVIADRNSVETIDFYDMQWRRVEGLRGLNLRAYNNKESHTQPCSFEEMKEVAAKLSKGMPFARIDLYEINGNCYFGEITLYPASGYGRFSPDEWNYKIGEWINIPTK